jgi:hypothetical protein
MAATMKRSFNLPKDLAERIEGISAHEDRTVNAQVVRWLEQKVREYEEGEKHARPTHAKKAAQVA